MYAEDGDLMPFLLSDEQKLREQRRHWGGLCVSGRWVGISVIKYSQERHVAGGFILAQVASGAVDRSRIETDLLPLTAGAA